MTAEHVPDRPDDRDHLTRFAEEREDHLADEQAIVERTIMGTPGAPILRLVRAAEADTVAPEAEVVVSPPTPTPAAETPPPSPKKRDTLPPLEPDWRIDDATRAAGVRGLAKARAELAKSAARREYPNLKI